MINEYTDLKLAALGVLLVGMQGLAAVVHIFVWLRRVGTIINLYLKAREWLKREPNV